MKNEIDGLSKYGHLASLSVVYICVYINAPARSRSFEVWDQLIIHSVTVCDMRMAIYLTYTCACGTNTHRHTYTHETHVDVLILVYYCPLTISYECYAKTK